MGQDSSQLETVKAIGILTQDAKPWPTSLNVPEVNPSFAPVTPRSRRGNERAQYYGYASAATGRPLKVVAVILSIAWLGVASHFVKHPHY